MTEKEDKIERGKGNQVKEYIVEREEISVEWEGQDSNKKKETERTERETG